MRGHSEEAPRAETSWVGRASSLAGSSLAWVAAARGADSGLGRPEHSWVRIVQGSLAPAVNTRPNGRAVWVLLLFWR